MTSQSGSTLTYDANGNMTSDGTNSYSWDAENRLIRITYPATNNFTDFTFDGLGRNVKIVETTAGSVTSTKQFILSSDRKRPYQPCEERDGAGVLTKKFFPRGQMNSSTKYFINKDHLSSMREMTDNAGALQAQYSYDPYGQVTKISESVASDFQYGEYYLHARSGLNLTKMRSYSSSQGRFISRDPIEDYRSANSEAYVFNNPAMYTDPSGLKKVKGRVSDDEIDTPDDPNIYQPPDEPCVDAPVDGIVTRAGCSNDDCRKGDHINNCKAPDGTVYDPEGRKICGTGPKPLPKPPPVSFCPCPVRSS